MSDDVDRSSPLPAAAPAKPTKPYPDFPLQAYANGQWGKKIGGQRYYFGVWADWKAALAKYEHKSLALYAGTGRNVGVGPVAAAPPGATSKEIEQHYAPDHLARLLSCSAKTIIRHCKSGRLRCLNIGTGRSDEFRVPASEVQRLRHHPELLSKPQRRARRQAFERVLRA